MLVSRSGPGRFREKKESEFACLESEDEGDPRETGREGIRPCMLGTQPVDSPTYFMLCAGHSDQ